MFEEIDARAYKNLRDDIKALINNMIFKMSLENRKTSIYIDRKQYESAEYHSGLSAALDDISTQLMDIIDNIDSARDEEIMAADKEFSEHLESETAADYSRPKQS